MMETMKMLANALLHADAASSIGDLGMKRASKYNPISAPADPDATVRSWCLRVCACVRVCVCACVCVCVCACVL